MDIKSLIGTYFQTSSRYRIVARLPPGLTGIQAMEQVDPDTANQIRKRIEKMTTDGFLRMYATNMEDLHLCLTPEEFAEYKKLGGGVYL